eukprot:6886399-Prymnesium_polylepis.1
MALSANPGGSAGFIQCLPNGVTNRTGPEEVVIWRGLERRLRVVRLSAHPFGQLGDGVHLVELTIHRVGGNNHIRKLRAKQVGEGAAAAGAHARRVLQGPLPDLAALFANSVLDPTVEVSLGSSVGGLVQRVGERDVCSNIQPRPGTGVVRIINGVEALGSSVLLRRAVP